MTQTLSTLEEKLCWPVVKNKVARRVNFSSAPPFSVLKWVREWKELRRGGVGGVKGENFKVMKERKIMNSSTR